MGSNSARLMRKNISILTSPLGRDGVQEERFSMITRLLVTERKQPTKALYRAWPYETEEEDVEYFVIGHAEAEAF